MGASVQSTAGQPRCAASAVVMLDTPCSEVFLIMGSEHIALLIKLEVITFIRKTMNLHVFRINRTACH